MISEPFGRDGWDRKSISALWVVGATLMGLVLLVGWLLRDSPYGAWIAGLLGAAVVAYEIYKVRVTLEWLRSGDGEE